jgi:hypothetical protein
MARDDLGHGRDADGKIGGPRYRLQKLKAVGNDSMNQ